KHLVFRRPIGARHRRGIDDLVVVLRLAVLDARDAAAHVDVGVLLRAVRQRFAVAERRTERKRSRRRLLIALFLDGPGLVARLKSPPPRHAASADVDVRRTAHGAPWTFAAPLETLECG